MTTIATLSFIGRILFGAYFAYSGYNHFKNQKSLTAYAKHKGVPSPSLAVTVSGILLIIGGVGFFLNIMIVQASIALIAFMVPTTLMMHAFWKEKDANAKMNEQLSFMKNLALIGALLMFLN